MSFDFKLTINTGIENHKVFQPDYSLAREYTRLFCMLFEVNSPLDFDGRTVEELLPIWVKAYHEINQNWKLWQKYLHPIEERSINIFFFTDYIETLVREMRHHPLCTLEVY